MSGQLTIEQLTAEQLDVRIASIRAELKRWQKTHLKEMEKYRQNAKDKAMKEKQEKRK